MRKILPIVAFCCILLFAAACSSRSLSSKSTSSSLAAEEALAFPGAEGFGRYTTGGRGGKVIKVTNLNDAGPGSLRAAIEEKGPRIVVFEVSGNIELKRPLRIENGDITIAGQTAPGDGICIQNYSVDVSADNVIIRFMRFRMGDLAHHEGDALGGRFQNKIMVDHCSMSWSTDECVSFYQNDSLTLQWCIISESLRNSVHFKGAHGYGSIWGGRYASFHHNLLASHDSRSPRYGEAARSEYALTDLVDVRNNVFYNWGQNNAYGAEGMNINIVNNYFKPGPASQHRDRILAPDKELTNGSRKYDIWGKFFIDGNYVEGSEGSTKDNWTYGVYKHYHPKYGTVSEEDKQKMRLADPLTTNNNLKMHSPQEAYELVLAYAGASHKRDAVDQRIINDVKTGTASGVGSRGSKNGIIDSQSDVGGWPVLKSLPAPKDSDGDGMPDEWEIKHKLNPNQYDANGRDLSSVYDNVEVYINSLVKHIIPL